MILWCAKCGEYRKRNSQDWEECKFRSRHAMAPANERFAAELEDLRRRAGAENPDGETLDRLGTLEALKRSVVESYSTDDSIGSVLDDVIHGGLHADHGGAFFWVRRGGGWDIVRSDGDELESSVSLTHVRRYGGAARRQAVQDMVRPRADEMRADPGRRAAGAGMRAVFADGRLWVDLGGEPRRAYPISAYGHGPAVPYGPGADVILERHGRPLPEPARRDGRWLEWFCDLLRIEPGMRRTFAAHVCHMFCTHQMTPAMLFDRDRGYEPAGRTTAVRLVREVVDPVDFGRAVMMAPAETFQLEDALKSSPVLALDYMNGRNRDIDAYLAAACEGVALPGGRQYGYARVMAACVMTTWGTGELPREWWNYSLPKVDDPKPVEELLARLNDVKPYLLYEIFGVICGALGGSGPSLGWAVTHNDMVDEVSGIVSNWPAQDRCSGDAATADELVS